MNNGGYRILKDNLVEYLGEAVAERRSSSWTSAPPELRFDDIARSFGVHGERVERLEDLGPAVTRALSLGRPALVDVIIERNARPARHSTEDTRDPEH